MRISDWSSDVCSSDLMESALVIHLAAAFYPVAQIDIVEIGQPREADLFEHRQRSEAARLCLRIKEGIDRRERPRQMIDDEIGRAACRDRVGQWGGTRGWTEL